MRPGPREPALGGSLAECKAKRGSSSSLEGAPPLRVGEVSREDLVFQGATEFGVSQPRRMTEVMSRALCFGRPTISR